jgi:hypothetical protein
LLNTVFGTLSSGELPAAPNSYESISTVTVGSGGAANIEFTSISSAYTHLQLRYFERATGSYNGGYVDGIQFNSDTGSNYSWHELLGDGSSASAAAGATQTSMRAGRMPAGGVTASVFGTTIVDILDYANTNKYKTIRLLGGYDSNGGGTVDFGSGNWRSTSAISSIKLIPAAETFAQYSSFALYGIKGS